ncbi:hypothetical protein TL16_g12544 [Triparma laevis f. inornata]|uniref:Origin recognition complex subunit 1 n=1 Tax=Triparma laevis f. inornata TaxID=1714386 RepID=A0A9W7EWS7_9STRA|nr:hypothetical protein TL16_g12544 [Triparma laevis f. inornata]
MAEVRWARFKWEINKVTEGWDLAPDEDEEIYETSKIDIIPVESIISNLTGLKFKISGFYESFTKRIIPLPEEEGRADEFKRSIKYSEILKGKGVKEATLATFEDGEEGGEELLEGEEGKLRKCLRLLSLSEENKSKLEERKEEKGVIKNFLKTSITSSGNSSNALFVAGPPGCGKTASVLSTVSELIDLRDSGKIPNFKFVLINAMSLRNPFEAYTSLWREISGENLGAGGAAGELDGFFGRKGGEKSMTVLLLDEMDYLVTRKQVRYYVATSFNVI